MSREFKQLYEVFNAQADKHERGIYTGGRSHQASGDRSPGVDPEPTGTREWALQSNFVFGVALAHPDLVGNVSLKTISRIPSDD